MELDLDVEDDVSKVWERHIEEKLKERLKTAKSHENGDVEIGDLAAIDSIEDNVVRCELLDGNMVDIPREKFVYDVAEGDVINLRLTYREGILNKIHILEKDEAERELRVRMMQEKLRSIKKRS